MNRLVRIHLSYSFKKIIIFILSLSSIYLLIVFIYPWYGLKKLTLPEIIQEKNTLSEEAPGKAVKPYDFYLQGIGSRTIFDSGLSVEQAASLSNANVDSMKDIKVVGIIAGEKTQAVIEDTKFNKTYYVAKNQVIGEMRIEDIAEGKVIISYQGKLFDFSL
jgi:type II secretory pathway component PulC